MIMEMKNDLNTVKKLISEMVENALNGEWEEVGIARVEAESILRKYIYG